MKAFVLLVLAAVCVAVPIQWSGCLGLASLPDNICQTMAMSLSLPPFSSTTTNASSPTLTPVNASDPRIARLLRPVQQCPLCRQDLEFCIDDPLLVQHWPAGTKTTGGLGGLVAVTLSLIHHFNVVISIAPIV
ncbi:MAG: hypothetical protein SGCHY_002736 [Lobulomycetales sp.]